MGQAGRVGAGQAAHAPRLLIADLAQRAAQAVHVARVLHCRRIGEELALAADGRLKQAAGQPAERADRHQAEPEKGAGVAPAMLVGAPHRHAQPPDHLQAPHQAHQSHVQAGVAVDDMAELVRHHALQLGPRQALERTPGDHHHGVVGGPAGGQGVDGVVARQHPGLRRRPLPAGQRHLLHHVREAPLAAGRFIATAGIDRARARQLGHVRPAAGQAHRLDPAAAQHEQQYQCRVGFDKQPGQAAGKGHRHVVDAGQHQVDTYHQADHDEDEQQQQPKSGLLGGLLVAPEAHVLKGRPLGAAS